MKQGQTTVRAASDERRATAGRGRRRATRSVLLLGTAVAAALAGRPAAMDAQLSPTFTPAPRAVDPATTTRSGSPASRASRARPAAGPTTQISLHLVDVQIDTVLEKLSEEAGFIILKSGPVEGRVTLISKQPVSPDEAVSLLNTVLKDSGGGYTAVRTGRQLKITTLAAQKKSGTTPVEFTNDPDQILQTDDLVTLIVPVQNIDAVKLKTDLQPLIGDTDISANAGSNSLILTDTKNNVRRIVEIIAKLDSKDALQNDIRVRQLKYADAAATAKLITDIFKPADATQNQNGNRGGGGFGRFGGFGGGGFPGGGGQGGQGATPAEDKGKTGTVTASSDARTNTVVITGPRETLDLIEKTILDKIDANPAADTVFFSYHVQNGQAVDIQNTINTMFGATVGGTSANKTSLSSNRVGSGSSSTSSFGSSSGGFGSGSGSGGGFGSSSGSNSRSTGTSSTNRNTSGTTGSGSRSGGSGTSTGIAADLVGQVQTVADSDTNTLLVITATRYQDSVKQLSQELDRPVPQVLIKVLVAEVTHDRSDDIGTDFSVLNLRASGRGQDLASSVGNATSALTNGGLAVSVLESNLTATFHALATAGKMDVLSRPYILTSDNQEANILVGQEVPIIQNARVTDAGQQINTVEYRDVGIQLDVTPHINSDGLVVMDVSPEISSISDSSVQIQAGVTSPIFNTRSATTHVGVMDGETIVIGGLMQDQKTQTITKIPVVGDIPYVGLLFQRDNVTKTKTELLIFLTPHVALAPNKLGGMAADEMRGLKLAPIAVQPGTFKENLDGMRRGGSTTAPVLPIPSVRPDRDRWEPEPKMP